jgi:hypothetical protein
MLTVKDVEAVLCGRLRQYDFEVLEDALSVVSDIASLIEFLESIYSDDNALANVAAKSYAHRNGFDKLVLIASSDPEFRLRLHIWWPNSDEVGDMHIHNHKWDFRSRIIEGSYRHQTYAVDAGGEEWHRYRCHSVLQKQGHQMEYECTQHLRCVFDNIVVKNSEYTIDHSILHKVSLMDPFHLTSTIILQSPVLQVGTIVYSREVLNDSLIQPRLCNADEVKIKIGKYLDMLS